MRYFILLSTLALAANGLPAVVRNDPTWTDASVLISNGTVRVPHGQSGFASIEGGTYGGAGGSIWTVWDAFAFRDAIIDNSRRIVYVRGRIDLTVLFERSPGVSLHVGSFTSLIGGDSNSMIHGGGIRIQNKQQVIIQNIKFHNALNYYGDERPDGNGGIQNMANVDFSAIDAIGIDMYTHHVWIDHCEFANDPWIWRNHRRRHDGLIDITQGANLISISNSIFRNHNFVSLIGNDDNNAWRDADRLKTTFYLNWFQGVHQRNPRVRFGEVHILNNLYTSITDYCVGAGTGAKIYLERNRFVNSRRTWIPIFVINPRGVLHNDNNSLTGSNGDNNIIGNVGWHPSQYYGYLPMNVNDVEQHVRTYAGTR